MRIRPRGRFNSSPTSLRSESAACRCTRLCSLLRPPQGLPDYAETQGFPCVCLRASKIRAPYTPLPRGCSAGRHLAKEINKTCRHLVNGVGSFDTSAPDLRVTSRTYATPDASTRKGEYEKLGYTISTPALQQRTPLYKTLLGHRKRAAIVDCPSSMSRVQLPCTKFGKGWPDVNPHRPLHPQIHLSCPSRRTRHPSYWHRPSSTALTSAELPPLDRITCTGGHVEPGNVP